MASSSSLFFFFLFFSFLIYPFQAQLQTPLLSDSAIFPVTTDPRTLQYITQIRHGRREKPRNLVIDLSSPFLWINNCDSEELIPTPSCSIQCSMAKPFHFGDKKNHCYFGTHLASCRLSVQNDITGLTSKGELVEDVIAVRSSKSGKISIEGFLFARGGLLNGLASEAQGVLGLGRGPIGVPSQLAAKLEFGRKRFVTCLSSSNGFLSFGEMDIHSNFGLTSLTYTNLVNYQDLSGNSQDYFINVRSIKVNGKRVALGLGQEGIGRTKISTIVPYTTLESTIYGIFRSAYLKAANYMNMTRVNPPPKGSPFDLCFSSKGGRGKDTSVPEIDLVLQSEMVKWRVNGRNSMVKLSDEVACLGILDGGFDSKTPIVIGGFQLEDMLLEFDLGTNMLGFSQASCADFVLESGVMESL